ncbi:hypothetical protein BJ170DRAFT_607641 [Xylariales sp. AK1849]|nr:hypothetical protein BJ170DRAFT_607641 [Xylariales sp. AK1849]
MGPPHTSEVRIAVVGAGLIGPRHARTIARSNVAKLVAIVDPAPAGNLLATELDVAHYTSVADMLQSAHKPDAAIICTPNHTHVAVAKELSSAGTHVLVEKPISTDVESGKGLLDYLDRMDVKVLVGHHRRFNPYMVAAKRAVSSGSLGRVTGVNGLWALYKPPGYFEPPAEWHRHETGGVVLINMIHEVDLLHHLFGPITRVHAEKAMPQRGYEAEEGAALTLRFRSGVVGSFFISDHAPSPYNFEAGTGENPLIPKAGQDFYQIFGTEASLSVPSMITWSYTGTQKSWHSALVQEKSSVSDGVPFELQLNHFCKVVQGEEMPSCTAKAGLAALIVCQAIKEALVADATVKIEEYDL